MESSDWRTIAWGCTELITVFITVLLKMMGMSVRARLIRNVRSLIAKSVYLLSNSSCISRDLKSCSCVIAFRSAS